MVVVEAPGRHGVLEAAAHRFVTQGYAATTLRQIADDVGIKAASIYHHFASKEDLFVAVLDRGIAVMVEAWDQINVDDDCEDLRLLAHVRAHLGALFEHGPFTAAHVTAFFTAPDSVRQRIVPVRDDYEQRWNALLSEVIDRRAPTEHHLGRLLLFGAMNSTIEWFDPSGAMTLDQLAGIVTDQFLHGVAR